MEGSADTPGHTNQGGDDPPMQVGLSALRCAVVKMFELDERIFRTLYGGGSASGGLYLLMIGLSIIGGGWGMLILVPILARTTSRRIGLRLLATLLITALAVFTLKAVVGRTRPCVRFADVHPLGFAPPSDPSFPSGHATGSFAFAAFVTIWLLSRPRTRVNKGVGIVVLCLFAFGVALSRVYLGVHFPSDVAGGALLGTALGSLGAVRHLRAEGERS